jgi:uncharacterized membrane protein/protein-disulfide isomerase
MPDSALSQTEISRRSLIAIRLIALTAVFVSAYLAWISFTHGTVAACGGESSHLACGHVLRSSWSRWLGVPVSLFGCAVYCLILLASFGISQHARRHRAAAWMIFTGLVMLAAGSALWFTLLQVFVIGKFCLFCMSIHLCGILIALILIASAVREQRKRRQAGYAALLQQTALGSALSTAVAKKGADSGRRQLIWPAAIAFTGLLLLVGGQILFPATTFEVLDADTFDAMIAEGEEHEVNNLDAELSVDSVPSKASTSSPTTLSQSVTTSTADPDINPNAGEADRQPPISEDAAPDALPISQIRKTRRVSLLDGKLQIDVYRHGVLGSSEAEHVIVELVDYTCKECRKLHHYVEQAQARYGDRLAIVVLPVPLEASCNPYIPRTTPEHVGACGYARLALAVSSVDRDVFGEFHSWLMESESRPSLLEAVRKASQLVDREVLKAEIQSEGVRQRMQSHLKLFKGIGRFPATIVGNEIIVGAPERADEYFAVIEEQLGITAQ